MLILILKISMFCVGLRISFEEGMILNPVIKLLSPLIYKKTKSDFIETKELIPRWFSKPLFLCVYCMPSIYGSLLYWSYYLIGGYTVELNLFYDYVVILFASSGLNGFIYSKI